MANYIIIYKEKKIKADNYILLTIIILYFILFFLSKRVWIMGLLVFPMISSVIYGCFKILYVFFSSFEEQKKKILDLCYGLFLIPFGLSFLYLIFSYPHIHLGYIIYFIAIIVIIIGAAAIIKGFVIDDFSRISRNCNICIGIFSIIFSIISCVNSQEFFIIYLIVHITLIILNSISRSMLYLSEFNIRFLDLRKAIVLKFLLEIISEPIYIIEPIK